MHDVNPLARGPYTHTFFITVSVPDAFVVREARVPWPDPIAAEDMALLAGWPAARYALWGTISRLVDEECAARRGDVTVTILGPLPARHDPWAPTAGGFVRGLVASSIGRAAVERQVGVLLEQLERLDTASLRVEPRDD